MLEFREEREEEREREVEELSAVLEANKRDRTLTACSSKVDAGVKLRNVKLRTANLEYADMFKRGRSVVQMNSTE